jgi:hypothetical protein
MAATLVGFAVSQTAKCAGYTGRNTGRSTESVSRRFVDRLHLHSLPCSAKVEEIITLPTVQKNMRQRVLELYHSVRDTLSFQDKRIQSILTNGFRIGYHGNKGGGVYLSSHALERKSSRFGVSSQS